MKILNSLSPHMHWLLRLSLAATFILHGIPKFPPDGLLQMGLPLIIAWGVAFGEIGAGVALLAGALIDDERLTRLGGLLIVIIMIGAITLVHFPQGWVGRGGMEFQALMLAAGMYFLTKGNQV